MPLLSINNSEAKNRLRLYPQRSHPGHEEFVVNTLSLSTLVTLFAFAIISVLYTPAPSGASLIHLP